MQRLAEAYRDRLVELGGVVCNAADFATALDACRLQHCVQRLARIPERVAPGERRHDWLAEALALGDRLQR